MVRWFSKRCNDTPNSWCGSYLHSTGLVCSFWIVVAFHLDRIELATELQWELEKLQSYIQKLQSLQMHCTHRKKLSNFWISKLETSEIILKKGEAEENSTEEQKNTIQPWLSHQNNPETEIISGHKGRTKMQWHMLPDCVY